MKRMRSCAFRLLLGFCLLSLCLSCSGCDGRRVGYFSYLDVLGISAELEGALSGERFSARMTVSKGSDHTRVTLCYLSPAVMEGITLSAPLERDGGTGEVTANRGGISVTLPCGLLDALLSPALSLLREAPVARVQKEGERCRLELETGGELLLSAEGTPLEYRDGEGLSVRILSWRVLSS